MFLICWGGSFAVISHEIDWLVNPIIRVNPAGEPAKLVDIYEQVNKAYPDAQIRSIHKPLYQNFAAEAILKLSNNQILRIYIDQYSLKIKGNTPFFNVQRYFRDFHQSFYGLLGFGKFLVTLFSFLLIGSLISGLYLYRKWWKNFFNIKVNKKNSKSFWKNIHKVIGLWSLWFVLVIGITGLWYLYEHVVDTPFAYVDTTSIAAKPLPTLNINKSQRLSFLELTENINSARPDLKIERITLNRGGYFYAVGQEGHILVRNRANKVFVNPSDGQIVYSQNASDLNAYWRWSDTADPLHFGNFAGIFSKLIWFIFGIFLSILSLTGTWLYIKRLQKTEKKIYHKGSLITIFISIVIFIYTMIAPFVYLIKTGPIINEVQTMAIPSFGVTIFISIWILITFLICLLWFWSLFRYRN